jgi:hypothetical protein
MRSYATSVCGLKLLKLIVYEAFSCKSVSSMIEETNIVLLVRSTVSALCCSDTLVLFVLVSMCCCNKSDSNKQICVRGLKLRGLKRLI